MPATQRPKPAVSRLPVRVELTLVTPELARHWLTRNTRNRPRGKKGVRFFVNLLRTGGFMVTHQGIAFDWDGVLLDGQHRLMAVVETGISAQMFVTFNQDPETFYATDTGGQGARTAADQLAHRNGARQNRNSITAIARSMIRGLDHAQPSQRDVVDVADGLYPLIDSFFGALRQAPGYRAPLAAAFVNAVRTDDAFPGPKGKQNHDVLLEMANRYGSLEWPKGDPGRTLYKFLATKRAGGAVLRDTDVYGYTVAAIRRTLAGKITSRALECDEVDWDGTRRPRKRAVED